MPGETLVGTPDPEDNRTSAEKYDDHLTGVHRDQAVEERKNDEFIAAVEADVSPVDLARMLQDQEPESEGEEEK